MLQRMAVTSLLLCNCGASVLLFFIPSATAYQVPFTCRAILPLHCPPPPHHLWKQAHLGILSPVKHTGKADHYMTDIALEPLCRKPDSSWLKSQPLKHFPLVTLFHQFYTTWVERHIKYVDKSNIYWLKNHKEFYCMLCDKISRSPSHPWTHYLAECGLELLKPLLFQPRGWDYRYVHH